MSAGPILIFDKSLIEMLSPDEAVYRTIRIFLERQGHPLGTLAR